MSARLSEWPRSISATGSRNHGVAAARRVVVAFLDDGAIAARSHRLGVDGSWVVCLTALNNDAQSLAL